MPLFALLSRSPLCKVLDTMAKKIHKKENVSIYLKTLAWEQWLPFLSHLLYTCSKMYLKLFGSELKKKCVAWLLHQKIRANSTKNSVSYRQSGWKSGWKCTKAQVASCRIVSQSFFVHMWNCEHSSQLQSKCFPFQARHFTSCPLHPLPPLAWRTPPKIMWLKFKSWFFSSLPTDLKWCVK